MDLWSALLVVLVLLILWRLGRRWVYSPLWTAHLVRSGFDGSLYRVQKLYEDRGSAADLIAALNQRGIELMRVLRREYARNPQAPPAQQQIARNLLDRYNPDALVENAPTDPSGDTSYTVSKGATLALCLRERDPAQSGSPTHYDLHDLDLLTFVYFHELAHVGIDEMNHPPAFWSAFKFLLTVATTVGFHPPNYALHPVPYCGMEVNYNPLYDPHVPLPGDTT